MSTADLSVLVVEDVLVVREGTRSLLALIDEVGEVTCAGSLDEAAAALAQAQFDLVVSDLRMPPAQHDEGVQLARSLAQTHPGLPVIILSQHAEPALAARLFEHTGKGRGYMLKERVASVDELRQVVLSLVAGGVEIDPSIVAGLVRDGSLGPAGITASLTAREAQVLEFIARGQSNAAIARDLGISRRTVENHATALFAKLGLADDDDASPRVMAALLWQQADVSR